MKYLRVKPKGLQLAGKNIDSSAKNLEEKQKPQLKLPLKPQIQKSISLSYKQQYFEGAQYQKINEEDMFHKLENDFFPNTESFFENILQNNLALITAVGKKKQTLLHVACKKGLQALVSILIKYGANLNTQDEDFNTPLHLAAEFERESCAEILLKQQKQTINLTLKNYAQQTAQDLTKNIKIYQQITNCKEKQNKNDVSNCEKNDFCQNAIVNNYLIMSNNRVNHVNKILYLTKQQQISQQMNQCVILNKPSTQSYSPISNADTDQDSIFLFKKEMTMEDFQIQEKIGEGSYGEIFKVIQKDSQKVMVMKMVSKEKIEKKQMINNIITECDIMINYVHSNLVKFKYHFETDEAYVFIMKYYPTDLQKMLQKEVKFNEKKAQKIMVDIIKGLEYLHKNLILYRDMKPANILIDHNGKAVLTDFGLSKKLQNKFDVTSSFCGTLKYLPPEQFDKNRSYNFELDFYQLGVILYEMVIGEVPYFNKNIKQFVNNICTGKLYLPDELSSSCKDLILNLLQRNQSDRLGTKNGIQDIKNHQWFSNVNWSNQNKNKFSTIKHSFKRSSEIRISQFQQALTNLNNNNKNLNNNISTNYDEDNEEEEEEDIETQNQSSFFNDN